MDSPHYRNVQRTRKRALIVSSHVPFPRVTGGNERLVQFLAESVFARTHEVWVAHAVRRRIVALYRDGVSVADEVTVDALVALAPSFVVAIDSEIHFNGHPIRELFRALPSFVVLQQHPSRTVPDALFRGLITHRSRRPHRNVLTLGGAYDPRVFAKRRTGEAYVVCVGRICPEKNQLALVRGYRERIWKRFGVPLLLAGGADAHPVYAREVLQYADGESVRAGDWLDAVQIAAALNDARFFVSPSPRETFGIALIEALACGTTAVVNGRFPGFSPTELAPHVYGNVTGRRGSILDTLERAFEQDIRIDASAWAQRYAIDAYREALMQFIEQRLERRRPAG